MRWPIRNQILFPFALMQILTVGVVSTFSAWQSIRSVESQVASRLDEVLDTLETSSYPLTPHILHQLRKLSGAHLIVLDEEGRSLGSTFKMRTHDFNSMAIPPASQSEIENLPVVSLEEKRYFAGYVNRTQRQTSERVLVLYSESQWREARSHAVSLPLLWGGILLLLTLLTSIWIARRIASRVQAVQQHVSRISTGDYKPVPYGMVDDELRNLSQAVNQMAGALEQSMRQARESERATMLAQLAGGLAHHLRNALTGARVSLQLHQKHCSTADDKAVLIALAQLVRAEEQIKALLRVSQGKLTSSPPSSLSSVLDDVAALVSPLCDHHRVDFAFDSEGTNCMISDAESMRGALLNLLNNAIEAAGPKGYVRLEASQKNGSIKIRVKDNGPGISAEEMQDIFIPFFTTKDEGIGIGLPVAKRAAEDCGGTLTITRADGMTVFEMSIPIQTQACSNEYKFSEGQVSQPTMAASMREMSCE